MPVMSGNYSSVGLGASLEAPSACEDRSQRPDMACVGRGAGSFVSGGAAGDCRRSVRVEGAGVEPTPSHAQPSPGDRTKPLTPVAQNETSLWRLPA